MCNFSLSSYAAIFLQFLSGNILNEYKWDKQNIVGLFYKLTDAHLSPAVQSAMKVTLAAQMTDHTVETSLNATTVLGKEPCSAIIVLYQEVKWHIQI